ncbi:MAG: endonuclease/exonuclease/phosphatase family protein [Deltaproteobacteria bacterium]|nr:endonuclease/exonuclease/phosphatase family protein [Deltaproteobacteria bacterium]
MAGIGASGSARGIRALLAALPLALGAAAGAGAAAGEGPGIVVGSFNIQWLGDGVNDHVLRGKPKRSAADFARLRGVVAGLGADIVVLQEVENETAVRRILPQRNWQVFISGRKTDAEWAQRVAIIARPGLQVRRLPDVKSLGLPNERGEYRLRYGVDVEISQGGQQFRLLGIHLKTGCFTARPGKWACEQLWKQLPPLKEWIAARAAESTPFVIAGDWNRELYAPRDELWAEIAAAAPAKLRLAALGRKAPRTCWNAEKQRVDHIVLGDLPPAPVWVREKAGDFAEHPFPHPPELEPVLSDHCPVTARLRFTAPR